MTPYVITTKARLGADDGREVRYEKSHRAVATLEEAQVVVLDTLDPHDPHTPQPAIAVPESGGSVGPLPDGTLIEVEQVDWDELGDRRGTFGGCWTEAEIIDAFNARVA